MNSKKLKITFEEGVYTLEGSLNEFGDLELLKNAQEPIIIDVGKLEWINSTGIRNLAQVVKGWGKKKFIYRNCPIIFIDAISLVKTLIGSDKGNGSIESLHMPIFCGRCDYEEEKFVTVKEITDGSIYRAPLGRCQKCGELMEVDKEYLTVVVNK